MRISQKVKELFKEETHLLEIYGNETNITFQCYPSHLQRTGSSVSHVFLIPSEKKVLIPSLNSFAARRFLERIVTADEIWVQHYEPESKAQSMAWRHPTSPVAKKLKKINYQPARLCLRFFKIGEVRFWFISFQKMKPCIDFHICGPMKEALRGRKFSSDEKVIGKVQNCLKT
jgi:hypothetical protein